MNCRKNGFNDATYLNYNPFPSESQVKENHAGSKKWWKLGSRTGVFVAGEGLSDAVQVDKGHGRIE
jgi:hypothetical protein